MVFSKVLQLPGEVTDDIADLRLKYFLAKQQGGPALCPFYFR